MWFVYVFIGLALLIVSGVYVQRRITGALGRLGAGDRALRSVRWVLAWLLLGFPLLRIASTLISRWLGRSTYPYFDGWLASWLLAVPFIYAVLVVAQSVPWLIAIDIAYLVARRWRGAAAVRGRAIAGVTAVGAFAVYTPVRILVERDELHVRHHQIGAAAPEQFRIAFLADVQEDVHTDGDRAREVYALLDAEHPDLVLSGGDWINTGPDYIEIAAAAAATLHSPLGTHSVRGDHEHFAYADRDRSVREVERVMRDHGIDMVSDDVRWFEHCGKRIAVAFLDNNYLHRTSAATLESLLTRIAGADRSILVTHQFDAGLAGRVAGRVDLVLAGHTHGGQVNPVVGVTHVPLARIETRSSMAATSSVRPP